MLLTNAMNHMYSKLATHLLASLCFVFLTASVALADINVLYSGYDDETEFIDTMNSAMDEAAASDEDVSVRFVDCKRDQNLQIEQFLSNISDPEIDAAVIFISHPDVARIAHDAAIQARKPLVFVNTEPGFTPESDLISVVLSNDTVAGRLLARRTVRQLEGQGNIAILRGDDNHAGARGRTAGYLDVFDQEPGMTVVKNETADWYRQRAELLVSGWLEEGVDIDAILANNDEMALGAVDALKARGIPPREILVLGVDGISAAIAEMRTRYLWMTLTQDAASQAKVALETAVMMANGQNPHRQVSYIPYTIARR